MYLVRTKDTQRLVGVFAACCPADLFNIIDEELDPFSCEYFEMRNGHGLFLDGQFVTQHDVENVECVAIEPIDILEAGGVRMTEQLDLAMPASPGAWKAFTKKNLATAFGVAETALDDPAVRALFQGQLGIYVPTALN